MTRKFKKSMMRNTILLLLTLFFLRRPCASLAQDVPGSLDPTFGIGGLVNTNFFLIPGGFGLADEARAVAIQPDGKIIAAGSTVIDGSFQVSRFALARYNPDGTLDLSFGSSGIVAIEFGSANQIFAIALQPDGKIVAGGSTVMLPRVHFALARFNPDGSLDTSFGTDGRVFTNFTPPDSIAFVSVIRALAIQSDGKIVAAGVAQQFNIVDASFALARYNADGSLDSDFGSEGKVITNFGAFRDEASAVAIQSNGRIVAAGFTAMLNGSDSAFALARYKTDGTLDNSFGTGGRVTSEFSPFDDRINALAIQDDGDIIAAGKSFAPFNDSDFTLVRYNPNGNLDRRFGSDGRATTDFSGASDEAMALVIQSNGKIIAAGTTQPGFDANDRFGLARYNRDGSLDTGFGTGGTVVTTFIDSTRSQAFALALQSDGRVVAAGHALIRINGPDFALARYETGLPRITGVSVSGKKLFIQGANFDDGAVIILNGQKQNTINDDNDPEGMLTANRAGRKIDPGQTVTLRVRNSDGALSQEIRFTRPSIM